jgi:cytochrome c
VAAVAKPVLVALALSLAIGASSESAAAGVVGSERGKAGRGEVQSPPADARGDPARGAQLYEARCGGCHSVDAHRVGPLHRGVFGRRVGTATGFGYTPALKASRLVWSEATLDAWLADPERLIPGQGMAYRVEQPEDRADLIAYLRELRSAPR